MDLLLRVMYECQVRVVIKFILSSIICASYNRASVILSAHAINAHTFCERNTEN